MHATRFIHLTGHAVSLVLESNADGPPVWRHFGLPLPPMPPESAIVIRCNAVDT